MIEFGVRIIWQNYVFMLLNVLEVLKNKLDLICNMQIVLNVHTLFFTLL